MEKVLIEFVNTLDCSFKKLLAEVGNSPGMSQLTIAQFQYIDAIHELEKPTITDIAEKLSITKASVSTGINKLITKGYVIKTQSDKDKRIFYLSLTKVGKQFMQTKYRAFKEYGDFISGALSKEEATQLEAILNKLIFTFRQT